MTSSLKTVCLVGANGTLGNPLLISLLQQEHLQTSILQRSNTTTRSNLPSNLSAKIASTISISPDFPVEELTTAFENGPNNQPFDAIVVSFSLNHFQQHVNLLEAAYAAGVKRYIPADWGSCDAADAEPRKWLELYRRKESIREKCEDYAARGAKDGKPFTWTAVVCGHFFDCGLEDGLLHFDLAGHKAVILDGGDIPASASTLGQIGRGLVKVLEKPAETENKAVYIHSFNPTQNQVLASLEKVSGKTWEREDVSSKEYLEGVAQKVDDVNKDGQATVDVVFVLGTVNADWTTREGFAMELLGLEEEDLDHVIERVVREHEKA